MEKKKSLLNQVTEWYRGDQKNKNKVKPKEKKKLSHKDWKKKAGKSIRGAFD